MIGRCTKAASFALCCALAAPAARAVVIATQTGGGNTTIASAPVGFSHVGITSVGTGIYLGNNWVLTANHVHGGLNRSLTLADGTVLNQDRPARRLYNIGDNSPTDMVLYHVAENPGLSSLTLATQTPSLGTAVNVIGAGWNREPNLVRWDTDWNVVQNGGTHVGFWYRESLGRQVRWGTNNTAAAGPNNSPTIYFDTQSQHGKVDLIATVFGFNNLNTTESQGVNGDSGGALFANGQLAGMTLYVGDFQNQPEEKVGDNVVAGTAVNGNATFYANIASYVDLITRVRDHDGDANLDGVVNFSDFQVLELNFGKTSALWEHGDFNLDRTVNHDDFAILQANYGNIYTDIVVNQAPQGVPEPAGLAMLSLATLLLRRRARV